MFARTMLAVSFASILAACSGSAPDDGSQQQPDTSPTSCADVRVTCPAATHCEMKGLNGGAVPVCIADPKNDPACPASQPEYGAPCASEGLACDYPATECGRPSVRDVTCLEGKWHWFALGACPP
jgi:hypothetical protein